MNRNLLIGIGAGAVILIGFVLYFFVFSSTPSVQVAPLGSTNLPQAAQNTLPSVPAGSTGSPALPGQPAGPVTVSSRLVKISVGPVVPGEAVTDSPASASSSPTVTVHYLERQSGNVFTYQAGSAAVTRTSNRTIPGIESAAWIPDGSAAVIRYLSGSDFSTVNSYVLPATGGTGFFLSQNLAGVAAGASGILATASGVNGSTITLERQDGSHAAQLFSTPLSQILVFFAGKNQYLVATKPSANLAGTAFLVDGSGRFTRLAGAQNGLTALASPSGKWVIVTATDANGLTAQLINTTTKEALPLPMGTIADKCVWTADERSVYCGVPSAPSADGQYPDDWYQGARTFSDRLWRIDVTGRYAQLVVDLSQEAGAPVDVEAPAIDANRSTFVFVNKLDGSLWSYTL